MAVKAVNIKMDEDMVIDIKSVAAALKMTMTDIVNVALDEYLSKAKQDPFYRLTANVQDASAEETSEVLDEIRAMSNDDLTIVRTKTFRV